MGVSDCVSFYAGYGEYHANKVNKIIHIIFVPAILWTTMGLLESLPIESSDAKLVGVPLNWGMPFLIHLLLDIYMDVGAGCVTLILYAILLQSAHQVRVIMGSQANMTFVIAQAISWAFQFIGHGIFEKRRPAFVDNILQVFAAPFFVVLEVMFLLGYKPELCQKCETEVDRRVKMFKRKGASSKN
eukprot:Selendium_serpulae@DN6100_c1_g1_i3.p1